jgi:hypothetical protein
MRLLGILGKLAKYRRNALKKLGSLLQLGYIFMLIAGRSLVISRGWQAGGRRTLIIFGSLGLWSKRQIVFDWP